MCQYARCPNLQYLSSGEGAIHITQLIGIFGPENNAEAQSTQLIYIHILAVLQVHLSLVSPKRSCPACGGYKCSKNVSGPEYGV